MDDSRCSPGYALRNPMAENDRGDKAKMAVSAQVSRHGQAVGASDNQRPADLLGFGEGGTAIAPWIGTRILIDTDHGLANAFDVRPGDRITMLDQGFVPLRAVIRHRLPTQGSFAQVPLRQRYFRLSGDIIVSPDQLVLISGALVEYLYGVEDAFVPARALCNGTVAEREQPQAFADVVALNLGPPALISADGCCPLSACDTEVAELSRRALAPFETAPLLALRGHTSLRHVAQGQPVRALDHEKV